YGAGFFYIPGTETCLKVGGLVRFEIGAHDADDFVAHLEHGWNTLARAEVTLDARSETEYGTLRGYIKLRANSEMKGYPEPAAGVNEGGFLSNGVNAGTAFVQDAIIELGGLAMGLTDTLYDAGISGEFDRGGGARVHFLRYTFDAAQGV